jgi:glycosyltransferase involved in cell wall biosynthesis
MRILLSAFSCSPKWGSESAVGWHWANELAREHQVFVITHQFFKGHHLEVPSCNPSYVYLSAPTFGMSADRYLNSRLYYCFWQVYCLFFCLRGGIHRNVDLVHHLTWGTFRFPSFLGLLGKPFFIGPVGGGERAPVRLSRSLPFGQRVHEFVRLGGIMLSKVDPSVWLNCATATTILCRTEESKTALPSIFWKKCRIRQEIGVCSGPAKPSQAPRIADCADTPLRALYAGRLIGWKGVHLAIKGVANARRRGVDVTLAIAGEGPLRPWLQDLANQSGIAEFVHFLGRLDHNVLQMTYSTMDVFVFPSLHDSGGSVVLEAMSAGLPIICLDLGGPRHFVNDEVGYLIRAASMNEADISEAIGKTLDELAQNRALLRMLSDGARRRHQEFSWERQVKLAYGDVLESLEERGSKMADFG